MRIPPPIYYQIIPNNASASPRKGQTRDNQGEREPKEYPRPYGPRKQREKDKEQGCHIKGERGKVKKELKKLVEEIS
jgi:hypothetical protein